MTETHQERVARLYALSDGGFSPRMRAHLLAEFAAVERAALERAAKECDDVTYPFGKQGVTMTAAATCAERIRALATGDGK